MKTNYLQAVSPYCGQSGDWTLLEGAEELRAELDRLAEIRSTTATKRDPHGRLCQSSENIASDFIVGVIEEIQARGDYPYNRTVQREVEALLGIEQQEDSASPLSWLVYRSQSFAEVSAKLKDGWTVANAEKFGEWAAKGIKVEMLGQTFIGSEAKSRALRLVQSGHGSWMGLPPKARNRGYDLTGKWVRPI